MRIFLASNHRYPASVGGPGGGRVFDWLVKGLTELGHSVFYHLRLGAAAALPEGATLVDGPVWDAEIFHLRSDGPVAQEVRARKKAWVATCHTDLQIWGMDRGRATPNWIYVSRHLARTYGGERYVLNGIDPAEFTYSETKGDYFLFVCALRLARKKGLDTAIALCRKAGARLVVAGSSEKPELTAEITGLCRQEGVSYVGEISGQQKADLFAGARALLFPTGINEAFGLVIAEALISGTPVICSRNGACPELVSAETGFICSSEEEYLRAMESVTSISPAACHAKAMRDYHYLRMAREYAREYQRELENPSQACRSAQPASKVIEIPIGAVGQ